MTKSAIYRYDLTIFETASIKDDLTKWCKQYCKKWGFQLEECPTTQKHHWQMRVSLKVKARKPPFMAWPAHVTPTQACLSQEEFYNYVEKESTRILGPFTDKDEPLYIPRQIRMITTLRPWQQSIIDKSTVWDTRHIDWIFCPTGNIGKSTLCGYIRANNLGRILPVCNDYKDLMEIICDSPTSTVYLMDLPRAIRKDKLYQLYSAIETLKDGYAFDRRYRFKEKIFDCPNIFVFSNTLPDIDLLSNDRWRIWSVAGNELIPFQTDIGL